MAKNPGTMPDVQVSAALAAAAKEIPGPEVYRRLLRFAVPHWRRFAIAIVGMIAYGLTDAVFAALLKPLVDGSFVHRDATMSYLTLAGMLGVFLVRGFGGFISEYFLGWVGRMVISTIRTLMFDKLLVLPARFYDENTSGVLMSQLTFNVEQVAQATTRSITTVIRDSITILALLGWMLYMNWRLAMIFFIVGPLMAITVRFVSKKLRKASRRIQSSMGHITHVLREVIEGHQVVKAFGGQDYERRQFREVNERNQNQNMRLIAIDSVAVPVVQLMSVLALVVIVALSTNEVMTSAISPGDFTSFVAAMALLLSPIKRLTAVNTAIQRGIAAGQSIFAFLDQPPEADTGGQNIARADGRIEFAGVSHRYSQSQDWTLRGIDLDIAAGKTVAIVGRSGSGKTTLVNLLPRFYDASEGAIRIDGTDIRELSLAALRRQIAVVGQHVTLFNDSIARNIAYGCQREIDRETLRKTAAAANALDFIERMPQGFETPVGEHGVLLSGGQRQRIAIARALLRDAPILILDEATSALDSESERKIQSALETLMHGRTTLVIAHRLSTIERADRIVVMQDGRIVEQGKHGDLLAHNGIYAELHRQQFLAAPGDAAPAAS